MKENCLACRPAEEGGRWKKFGAWTGLIFFCPCHLPLTITGLLVVLTAAGIPIAGSWGKPLLYGVFGVSFVFFLVVVLRMVMRKRDQERAREAEHAIHVPTAAVSRTITPSAAIEE